MSRNLTEQKVLKKLDIDDFRHITKDKVIKMFSMLDKMDPEVAKKALEQFPEFAGTMKQIISEYRVHLDTALAENRKSTEVFYDACKGILNSLQQRLDTEELNYDQRKEISQQMIEVAKMIGDKDTQNKNFIFKVISTGASVAGFVLVAGLAVLGGNTSIGSSDKF